MSWPLSRISFPSQSTSSNEYLIKIDTPSTMLDEASLSTHAGLTVANDAERRYARKIPCRFTCSFEQPWLHLRRFDVGERFWKRRSWGTLRGDCSRARRGQAGN